MSRLARALVAWPIGFLPPERRTWSEAALAELDEAEHPLWWALGALVVVAREGRLALAQPVLALGVLVSLAGAFVSDTSVILDAWSWSAFAIVAFVLPTAVVGVAAALATLGRSRLAPVLAWSFFALVAVLAVLAFTNARPVGTVFRDYERTQLAHGYTAPPDFAREGFTTRDVLRHHAEERRVNGSAFALLVALAFAVAVTRRRVART